MQLTELAVRTAEREPTLTQNTDCVVERHRLDIEGRENGLLVGEGGVVVARHFSRQDTAHVTQIHVNGTQVCSAQR